MKVHVHEGRGDRSRRVFWVLKEGSIGRAPHGSAKDRE